MKKFKICSILLASLMGVGAIIGITKFDNQAVETKADDTVKTISEICGFTRIAGENSKTYIAFSAKETLGTYQKGLTGNVFDAKGNPMPLVLYPNGAASGAWVGDGTRRYELKTDSSDFLNAIGSDSTFYITKDSIFDDGSTKIKFAKEYVFKHIYDGSCTITEASYAEASFKIAEMVTRVDSVKYRAAVKDMSNIAAGFADVFKGEVVDAKGNVIKATITDAGDGSTASGNRKIHIVLDSQASSNTFFIKSGDVFYNTTLSKKLLFTENYKIANATLSICDGVNHVYGPETVVDDKFVKTCEACGHTESRDIPVITPTLGTSYYSTITAGDPNYEISLKVSGCSNLDGAASTYRGKAKLDGSDIDVKITVTGTDMRFYVYVSKDSDATSVGHLFIDSNTKFANDGTFSSYLQFASSFYLGYDDAHHITKCDGVNHTYGPETVVDSKIEKTCKGCGHTESRDIPVITPTLGTSYYSTITAGDPNYEISLKVSGCSNLDGAASTYRGKAKLDGSDIDVKITVTGTDMRFYVYVSKDSDATSVGHLFIDSNTKFANDGTLSSYLQFASSFYLGYDDAHHITRCDGITHTYGEAKVIDSKLISVCKGCGHKNEMPLYTLTFGNSDKWASVSPDYEVSIKIGGCSGLTGAAASYRGDALLNGSKQALKIQIDGATVRIWMFLTEENPCTKEGIITIDENTLFKADGDVLSYLKVDKSVKIKYNTLTNKYRIDPADYEYVATEVSNVVNKNWIENTGSEISLSYNDVILSNGAETTSNIVLYRGKAFVDDVEKDIRVGLLKNNDKNKLVFYFPGQNTGTLKVLKNQVFVGDSDGTYFSKPDVKIADSLTFSDDLTFVYDVDNQLVNAKFVTFSFSGVGAWSQQVDLPDYNSLASFNTCSIEGIHKDESELTPDGKHRGYHFYGIGYDKNDESKQVPVDIWVSEFSDGDASLNTATVKAAVYTKIESVGGITGIKLHKDDLFISSHYNMVLTLDDDYLIKWYVNSSRTTAGKYNNDKVGPVIYVDTQNIPTFTEGDLKPTLPVAVEDDVDDVVEIVNQTWQTGAVDANGKLVAGTWKVTITAKDAAGNDAVPVEFSVKVNKTQVEPIPDPTPDPTPEQPKKGCGGSIIATSGIACLTTLLGAGLLIIKKRKED